MSGSINLNLPSKVGQLEDFSYAAWFLYEVENPGEQDIEVTIYFQLEDALGPVTSDSGRVYLGPGELKSGGLSLSVSGRYPEVGLIRVEASAEVQASTGTEYYTDSGTIEVVPVYG